MKLIIDCDPGNGIPGANVDDAIALAYAGTSDNGAIRRLLDVAVSDVSDDGRRAAVPLAVEDLAGLVVAGVAGDGHPAADAALELVEVEGGGGRGRQRRAPSLPR